MADFRVTPDFIDVYESLRDDVIAAVDDTVVRLLTEHMTLWARRGLLVGPGGSAWIIEFGIPETALTLYWNYLDGDLILFVLLVERPATRR